jgi:hypothetical protein
MWCCGPLLTKPAAVGANDQVPTPQGSLTHKGEKQWRAEKP